MDPRTNPYAPGAGSKPPALVGRDDQVESFGVLLERLENGFHEQSMIVTGLRGVGKTVLLDVFRETAESRRWATIEWEVEKNQPLGPRMAMHVRRALIQIAPKIRWGERMRQAASALKSFSLTFNPDGSVTAGLDADASPGIADSGSLGDDLTDLLVSLGHAAREHGVGVVFLIDEIQYLGTSDFEALIMALHKCARRSLPVTLVGAGLPQIPRLAGEAKSYSERLFRFPTIGALDPSTDARDAITIPASAQDVGYASDAVDFMVDYTGGYPYFLQEYGKVAWDESPASPITLADVTAILPLVEARLDESFFRVRAERTTETELKYLYAMAVLGPAPHSAAEVAGAMGKTSQQAGPIRSRLIDKGLLYAPNYGLAAFTVPQFDRFMKRAYSDFGNVTHQDTEKGQ
ncbi:MAG: ATP-binding protein [Coriobacteriales bacterium]|nr:ATP-binding protein [Coriobacteriales bacterium]